MGIKRLLSPGTDDGAVMATDENIGCTEPAMRKRGLTGIGFNLVNSKECLWMRQPGEKEMVQHEQSTTTDQRKRRSVMRKGKKG